MLVLSDLLIQQLTVGLADPTESAMSRHVVIDKMSHVGGDPGTGAPSSVAAE